MNQVLSPIAKRKYYTLVACLFATVATAAFHAGATAQVQQAIQVDANIATYNAQTKTRVFEGDVVIARDNLKIGAERVEIKNDPESEGDLLLTITGNPATLRDKSKVDGELISGQANSMNLSSSSDIVLMEGDVIISNASATLRSGSATFDRGTGEFVAGRPEKGQSEAKFVRTTVTISE